MNRRAVVAATIVGSAALLILVLRDRPSHSAPDPDGRSITERWPDVAIEPREPASGGGLMDGGPSTRTPSEATTATAPEATAQEAEFHAMVLDARSRTPVAAVLSWCSQRAIADASGVLRAYCGGDEVLGFAEVSALGYETVVLQPVDAGPHRWNRGTVLLSPAMRVTVRVTDEHGSPVVGASLSVAKSGRSGALWDSWEAGVTDSEGKHALRAKQGELVFASYSSSNGSANAIIREGVSVVDLVLSDSGSSWIGLRCLQTGQPLAGIAVDVVSRKSVPGLHWAGATGPDGRLSIPLPARQVALSTPGPVQFVSARGGFSTTRVVELGSIRESTEGVHWIEMSRNSGRWLRFLGPTGDQPLLQAVAESFRTVDLPNGQVSEMRVGSQALAGGMLNLEPYIDSGTEPLHVIVTAPGAKPFDSRKSGFRPLPGEVRDVRLESLKPGVFRLVSTTVPSSDGSRRSVAGRVSVWIFTRGNPLPITQLQSDVDGFVRGVPNLSREILVCIAPSPTAVIGKLMPGDLDRDPPVEVRMPELAGIVVSFQLGEVPHEELEVVSDQGASVSPRLDAANAVFENLPPGRYALGTTQQLAAKLWKREFDPSVAFPVELLPGQVLRIRADPSWIRRADNPRVLRGVVLLDGPEAAFVVPLAEPPSAEHFIVALRSYSPIDANGGYELPASPDVLSLSVGSFDHDTGVFVPLTVFAPGDLSVVAKGARLVVRAAKELEELAILELKIQPRDFKAIVSLHRGVEPGGRPADFGWIPLGEHFLRPLGTAPTKIAVVKSGLLELDLLEDGSIVPKR